ncbi:MAG TPA: autotransporter-associated beta strand repeat-containing protein, partial [Pirellulales bacterium]
VLTGTNTYSGGTNVSGSLVLNNVGGAASGSGDVTLSGTGALATTLGDTITGNLNVGTGTTVTIGNTSTLTVNGASGLSFASANGATLDFNLSGGSNSNLAITNNLAFGATGTDTINITGTAADKTYVLMNFAGENVTAGSAPLVLGSVPLGDGNSYTLQNTGTQELLVVAISGGNLIWDASGAGVTAAGATDGSGNWSNGSTNFVFANNSGQAAWDNSASDAATFGNSNGPAGAVTLTSAITVNGSLTFEPATSGSYTIAASAGNELTLVGGIAADASAAITGPTILGANQTWTAAGGTTLTVGGVVSEINLGTTLTLGGSGIVALGGDNTFSGGTILGGGVTAQVSSATSLGAASGGVTINAATLEATATFAGSRNINLNDPGAAIMVDANQTYTVTGVVSGTGNLNVTGPGTLAFAGSANNTYSGQTFVDSGTLLLNTTPGVVGIVGDGVATRATGADFQTNADLIINGGNLLIADGDDNVLDHTLSVTLTSGTVNVGNSSQTIFGFNNLGGTLIVPRYATWTVSDPNYFGGRQEFLSTANGTDVNLGQGAVTVIHGSEYAGVGGNGVRTVSAPGGGDSVALTFSQQDASNDSSQIRINSELGSNAAPGIMILTGDVVESMTYGGASITNGMSQLDQSVGLRGDGPWVDNGYGSQAGLLDLAGAARTFTIAASTHDASNPLDPGVDMLISAQIQNGGIVKDGAGTLFLSNAGNGQPYSAATNTFTGGVVINAGTVQIDTATSLGGTDGSTTGITTINGGMLEAVANTTIVDVRPFALGSATTTILVDSGSTYSIGGAIADGSNLGTLNVTGAGTLVLTGTNTYSGGTNVSGSLVLNNAGGSASGSGDVTLSGTGALATTLGDTITGNLNVGTGTTVTIGNASTLTVSGATGLSFASANGTTFDFNLGGASNSAFAITNNLAFGASGTDTINITGTAADKTYVLMNFAGENVVAGSAPFMLGSVPSDGNTYKLENTGTQELLVVAAATGSLIWDASGTGVTVAGATDGSGNWSNDSTNFVFSDGSGQTTWSNAATESVTFGNSHGPAGTVTLTSPIT